MKETTLHRMYLNRIAEGGDSVRYMVRAITATRR